MDQNSPPPSGETPERPMGETPQSPPQQPGAYAPPPGGYAPPPQGYPQQPGAPPPGYQPQGYPPPGYSQPGGGPPPGYYPPPGPPQGYPPPGYGAPPKRTSGMPAWAWVLIGLLVVIIISCVGGIAALTYLGSKVNQTFSRIGSSLVTTFEPIAVATEFYTALDSKDYDSAHALLSPSLASKNTSDNLRTKWEALGSAQGTITTGFPTTRGTSSNANSATVDQELLSAKGKTYRVTLQMEKSGSTWLIKDASPGLIPEP
jgi:hypothetical protein